MAVNKVEYADETLIDLTSDTVTAETLAEGVTAHAASGETVTGTMGPILYNKEQSLTDEQKAQARANAGVLQADLSQNDSSQPDYVKNRTHWVEEAYESNILEWDGDITGQEAVSEYYHKISDVIPSMDDLLGGKFVVKVVGTVTADDIEYTAGEYIVEITSDTITSSDVNGVTALGLIGETDIGAIQVIPSDIQIDIEGESATFKKGLYFSYTPVDENNYAYVKSLECVNPIFGSGEVIHKLDNKFIDAEWMATTDTGSTAKTLEWDGNLDGMVYADISSTESFTEYAVKISDSIPTEDALKAATTKVNIGGTVYTSPISELWDTMVANGCVTDDMTAVLQAYDTDGDGEINSTITTVAVVRTATRAAALGLPSTGIYFLHSYDTSTSVTKYTTALEIEMETTAPSILPEKFLPESVKAPSDWNAAEGENGHVLNRTHYTELVSGVASNVLEWDGDKAGKEYIDASGTGEFCYVKVSDTPISKDSLVGATIVAKALEDGNFIEEVTTATSDNIEEINENLFHCFEYITVATADTSYGGVTWSKGIYLQGIYDNGVCALYTSSVTCTSEVFSVTKEVVHTLPEKFLPSNVPVLPTDMTDITDGFVVASSSAGSGAPDTFEVASLSDRVNSIINEREAENPHLSANSLTLTDTSTGKLYKLEVTDGKLTMTEVTE